MILTLDSVDKYIAIKKDPLGNTQLYINNGSSLFMVNYNVEIDLEDIYRAILKEMEKICQKENGGLNDNY